MLPPEKLPRQFRFKGEGERERLAAAAVESVVREIGAAGMGQLLLSSEYFSREFTEDELLRMQVLLARLGVTELDVQRLRAAAFGALPVALDRSRCGIRRR